MNVRPTLQGVNKYADERRNIGSQDHRELRQFLLFRGRFTEYLCSFKQCLDLVLFCHHHLALANKNTVYRICFLRYCG